MHIRIIRPKWEREMQLRIWSEEPDYMIMVLDAPARDKGTVFLKRDKEIWNYLPRIGRSVKLPPSMMGQSWMGSDLNNDDLVRENSVTQDYNYEYLDQELIREKLCHKIKLIPKEESAVVWDHIIVFITEEGDYQWQTDFYNEKGELVNRLEAFEITDLGGRALPKRMRMTPMETPEQYTEMEYIELDFSVKKPDNFFSLQNLQRLR
jgi:outer membrane lipoprotein-sorting protein